MGHYWQVLLYVFGPRARTRDPRATPAWKGERRVCLWCALRPRPGGRGPRARLPAPLTSFKAVQLTYNTAQKYLSGFL